MALDGIFLRHIKNELEKEIIDTRVDKIYQPSSQELVITMRSFEGTKKLLLSSRPQSPRINITGSSYENPKTPPMLCMLLRKRLGGGRLRKIEQPGLDRILFLRFECTNELGDTVMLTLAVEIMGQYSNIILIDENGTIIDAVKRVDASMSSQRLVLPGITYKMPPQQDKLSVLESDAEDIIRRIELLPKTTPLSKALLSSLQGVSPIICREIEHLTGRGADVYSDSLDEEKRTRLSFFLKRIIKAARECSGQPYIITDNQKKPIDFTFTDIQQYGTGRSVRLDNGFCSLLDKYYAQKDAAERIRQSAEDLNRLLNNAASRLIKKIYIQKDELESCADREHYRICGDIIQANLYRIPRGAEVLEAENFYDEKMSLIKIKLDPSISPAANSQKYYKSYQKAKNAEKALKLQLERAEEELSYVDSVLDLLSRAKTLSELDEIRTELREQGYIKSRREKGYKKQKLLCPMEYCSESGFKVLVGRNNRQNDELTLKSAAKNDIWFHTKDIPGSHTVLVTNGLEPDDKALVYAASLAAAHSKAKESSKVPVDYTRIRYVSKPQGAKPGMVIYTHQKTLYVEPLREDDDI